MAKVTTPRKQTISRQIRNTSRVSAYFAAIFSVAFFTVCPVTNAQNLSAVVRFDIKAQPLDSALLEFGRQAHIQIMFASTTAEGQMRTRQLEGPFTGAQALAILLRGTGLTYSKHRDSLEVIPLRPRSNDTKAQISTQVNQKSGSTVQGTNDPPMPTPPKNSSHKTALDEVIVTGSRLPTTARFTAQEVQIYDNKQIVQSGMNSVSRFLSTLPSVSLTSPSTALGVVTSVTLRGLPVGTTLVLLNGRRLENSGTSIVSGAGEYFNLSNIPLAAVQRIEVDQNGSSAVYGSDAIGGVVNIILKKNLNGFELNAKYDWAKDLGNVRTDLAWGRQWHQGGLSIIANYTANSALLNTQRMLTSSNNYTRYGGANNNYPVCSPGNVFSINGSALPGAPTASGATYAAITGQLAGGTPTLSQFTYGSLNECSLIFGDALLPSVHRAGVLVQGHLKIAPDVKLFSEIMYTHNSQVQQDGFQGLFGMPGYQEYTISAANPYNPFGTTVGVAAQLHDVPVAFTYETDFFRPLIGLKGTVAHRWQWELAAWQSIDWTQNRRPHYIANSTAIQDALNAANPATALNPFVTGPAAPPSILNALFSNGEEKSMGRDREVEAFVRGPIARLPGGEVQAVIGADYIRSHLYLNDINNGIDPPNTRQNFAQRDSAVFAEARIPVIRRHASVSSGSVLTLTLSGRHDQYSDVGGKSTAQFGLEFRPTNGLLVRGTYAEAFKTPPLSNLYLPDNKANTVITDPVTGALEYVELIFGGNSRLHPETGSSHTVGIVYSMPAIPRLRLLVTQWQVVQRNSIETLPPQAIVDNSSAFPGRVIRNSAGTIMQVNNTFVNFGSLDVAGIDYQVDWHHSVVLGTASITADATETYHYRAQLTPGVAPVDSVSKAMDNNNWAPRWKGLLGFGWSEGMLSAHVSGRYVSSYQDYDSTRRIGNFWIFDTNFRWNVGKSLNWIDRWGRGAYLEWGVVNLFNRAPQYSNYVSGFYGFDASQSSIVGRSLYAAIGVRW